MDYVNEIADIIKLVENCIKTNEMLSYSKSIHYWTKDVDLKYVSINESARIRYYNIPISCIIGYTDEEIIASSLSNNRSVNGWIYTDNLLLKIKEKQILFCERFDNKWFLVCKEKVYNKQSNTYIGMLSWAVELEYQFIESLISANLIKEIFKNIWVSPIHLKLYESCKFKL